MYESSLTQFYHFIIAVAKNN